MCNRAYLDSFKSWSKNLKVSDSCRSLLQNFYLDLTMNTQIWLLSIFPKYFYLNVGIFNTQKKFFTWAATFFTKWPMTNDENFWLIENSFQRKIRNILSKVWRIIDPCYYHFCVKHNWPMLKNIGISFNLITDKQKKISFFYMNIFLPCIKKSWIAKVSKLFPDGNIFTWYGHELSNTIMNDDHHLLVIPKHYDQTMSEISDLINEIHIRKEKHFTSFILMFFYNIEIMHILVPMYKISYILFNDIWMSVF